MVDENDTVAVPDQSSEFASSDGAHGDVASVAPRPTILTPDNSYCAGSAVGG
jgi:hypothetical protein